MKYGNFIGAIVFLMSKAQKRIQRDWQICIFSLLFHACEQSEPQIFLVFWVLKFTGGMLKYRKKLNKMG
jgi:hypothetical protein